MGYAILIFTIIVYFIRPAEWIPALYFNWNLLLNGIALVMFAQIASNPKASFNADRMTKFLFAFFAATIVSNIMNGQFGTIGGNLMQNLTTIIIFVLIQSAINTGKQVENFILVIMWLTMFICYQCYLQATQGENWGGLKPLSRSLIDSFDPNTGEFSAKDIQVVWYGILMDPNDLGMFLVAFLPYAFNKVVYQDIGLHKKGFWALVIAVVSYTVILTNSRGTMLSFIAGLGCFYIIKTRSLVGLIAAGVIGVGLLAVGPSRMGELTSGDYSAMGRVYAWILALDLFVMNPLFGVGAKHFTDYHAYTTHNSYVLAFVENGMVGFVSYMAMFIVPVYTGVKVAYAIDDKRRSTEVISLVCGLLAIGLAMFFISRTYVLMPFLYMAVMTSYMRVYCPEAYKDAIGKLSLIKLGMFSAGFIVFVYIFNRLATGLLL